ncbi:hypothetical protein EPUS_08666 [Endocarpon pusillum Z07020]|uniref:Uncharacterized protein n=1 Tax=Endocarpon pusillum (strain Z07020 / HMAS-L-300199) TaxID=1263415 RepID=U1HHB1_ENDPU|nr:uncharacterized protein EPUS_08666 [Endocarpon pusillum Z07020]ERF68229.1 hypothetical protein EPUS_08666 [Endocarpon pusillum Z07020]
MESRELVGDSIITLSAYRKSHEAAAVYCGSTESYCFTSYGCQSGCVDPPAFYQPPSSTPTPTPTPAPVLTTAQKSGIIAGAVLFTLTVILAILFWQYKKGALKHRKIRFTFSAPNGVSTTAEFPQSYARQAPMVLDNATNLTLNGHEAGAGGRVRRYLPRFGTWSTRRGAETNAMYNHDLDDIRVWDVSSETEV